MFDPKDNPSFCVLPWVHRLVDSDGKLRECCNVPTARGHISEWEETWNDEEMREIRRKMVAGEQMWDLCKVCYNNDKGGKMSDRVGLTNSFMSRPEVRKRIADSIANDFHVDDGPMFLEFRFGSLCNLRCKMCSGHNSTTIRKDSAQLKKLDPEGYEKYISYEDQFIEQPTDWFAEPMAMDRVKEMIPYLTQVHFSGGEPTMLAEYTEFLQLCVDMGYAKNIKLDVCTNATNIKPHMVELIEQFGKSRIQCSIDGIGGTYDYVRAPGNWDKVRGNLITIMDYTHGGQIRTGINVVVQIWNILNITDMIDEFMSLYNEHAAHITLSKFNIRLQPLVWPHMFQINKMPQNVKDVALKRLRDWRVNNHHDPEILNHVLMGQGSLDMIEGQLAEIDDTPYDAAAILNYAKFTDQNKKKTVESNLPELYNLLKESADG